MFSTGGHLVFAGGQNFSSDLYKVNFALDGENRMAKKTYQSINLPSAQHLMKLCDLSVLRFRKFHLMPQLGMPHLGSFKHNMTVLPGRQCQAPPSVHYKLLGYASKYRSQACLFCTISQSSAMQHL